MIDFKAIAAAALPRLPNLLPIWLPEGRVRGHEYVCAGIHGGKGDSMSVNMLTGVFCDFADPKIKGGDPIALLALIRGCSQLEAAKELDDTPAPKLNGHASIDTLQMQQPPNAEFRAELFKHSRHGTPSMFWIYRDGAGDPICAVARYDQDGQKKQIVPWIWNSLRWHPTAPPRPRPLYGQDRLEKFKKARVVIVEGEKCADAAERTYWPDRPCISWMGGVAGVNYADWEPLRGRRVTLWPDNDEPGRKAMKRVREILIGLDCKVISIDTKDFGAEGFDLWDAEQASMSMAEITEYATSHVMQDAPAAAAETPKPDDEPPAAISPAEEQPPPAEDFTWPDPVNLFGEMSAPEFSGNELPAVLSEFALAFARSTGFDPSLTLSSAVSVAAAALNDGFQIVGDSRSQWFQQARLWILSIGRPGTGKTPVQKAMLGPLWEIQKALTAEHDRAVASAPEGEKVGPIPRVIVGDTTIEALSERLRGNPRGLLLANDEFESWLGSHDAYRQGAVSRDRGEWLRLFDGGPHTIERIQRGSVFVENWGASILTATTPSALLKLTRALPEDGLLQRFIPVVARRKIEPESVVTLDASRTRYVETIKRLFAASPRAHSGCVPLSVAAQEFFQTWMRQNQLTQEAFGSLEPALESHLSKYPSFLLRLALTFHAADIINQEHVLARDPAAFPVSLATMETAARFLKRSTLHAIAVYLDRKSGNDVYELARDTARTILARGWASVARRDLIQSVHSFRKADDQRQDSSLRLLVDLGWLRYAEGGYYKATPTRYEVNPGLKAKFAAVAQREIDRRAIIRDLIAQAGQARKSDRTEIAGAVDTVKC